MSTLYESPAERKRSIAVAAGLRDAVDAYRASCVKRYVENGPDSDAWFAERGVAPEPISIFTPRQWGQMSGAVTAKYGLPSMEAGRDSTNIQSYSFFADSVVKVAEKEQDDRTSDDYSQGLDVAEAEVEMRLELGDEEVRVDSSAADSLLIPSMDRDEPELHFDFDKDTEFIESFAEVMSQDCESTFTQRLTEAIFQYGQDRHRQREVLVSLSSGDLASSWSRVEQCKFLYRNGRRLQHRGNREKPPKFIYKRWSRDVTDATSGKVVPQKVAMFDSPEMRVLESLSRRMANKSVIVYSMRDVDAAIFDMTLNQMNPPVTVHYPEGPMRTFSREIRRKVKRMSWRRVSAFCAEHIPTYRLWLDGGEFALVAAKSCT